ncbi:intradiol ring-cleavage dioxygenase [Streptomyces sp. NBC_01142]|uniref:intradiol ring-cleavage dioxygenase n=1 Tax=Streptomyces sp. NBC_01142 TaxID=2975865 RepID=UPI0022549A9C|nr:intradiol ring-cleavage dioxygenase [Streptomyces sp. NBC_01142]MCX4824487.1 intradiol ring-cleavage dioxygenase [Streptomyces sp. NBC_01142]
MTETQGQGPHGPAPERDMTRRRFVVAGGAAVVAVGAGGAVVTTASAGQGPGRQPVASREVCYRLTSEATEGPYYIDADKIRKDITEDREGIPTTLRLKVIDSGTCKPLRGAAVDVWHCDALGLYSGYERLSTGGRGGGGHQEPADGKRYLRGTQLTDRNGFVEFRTVFPGWYPGRCVHIHTKVNVGGRLTSAGYEGGHTCHTGQLFFAEEAVLDCAKVAPYRTGTTQRTTLDEDRFYRGTGAQGGLLALEYKKGRRIAEGVRASLTLGVAPNETHDGTS